MGHHARHGRGGAGRRRGRVVRELEGWRPEHMRDGWEVPVRACRGSAGGGGVTLSMRELFALVGPLIEQERRERAMVVDAGGRLPVDWPWLRGDEIQNAHYRRGLYMSYARVVTLDATL